MEDNESEVVTQLPSKDRAVFLSSFPNMTVKKPLVVSIVFNGDDFVATFFDAAISVTGDTAEESVWNLQDIIALKFHRFSALPSTSLGKIPSKQLAILREYVSKD